MELSGDNSSVAPKSMSSAERKERGTQVESESDRLAVKQGMIWRPCSTKEIIRGGQRSARELSYTCKICKGD